MSKTMRLPALIVLTALLHWGPVAACLCADDGSMPAMPCCPGQPAQPDLADPGVRPDVALACAPMPGTVLLASSIEPPAPVAIAPAPPADWPGLDPPRSTMLPLPQPYLNGPPLYLTTLRLRI
jgi:hypothetical protein